MSTIQTIILAIVEGLTEFLPISSTGHLIITSSFMGIEKDEFTKLFEVAVQLGAILAVVVFYWKKFFDSARLKFYVKLIIGVTCNYFRTSILKKNRCVIGKSAHSCD